MHTRSILLNNRISIFTLQMKALYHDSHSVLIYRKMRNFLHREIISCNGYLTCLKRKQRVPLRSSVTKRADHYKGPNLYASILSINLSRVKYCLTRLYYHSSFYHTTLFSTINLCLGVLICIYSNFLSF